MAARPTSADLQGLRLWRTWLLVVAQIGQGLQNILAPDRALATAAYRALRAWHAAGWQVVGAALILSAVLLTAAPTRPAGHVLGAVVFGVLLVACLLRGYWPGLILLTCGLHLGEVAQLGRERARREAGR
jgi:hypothetical protein